MYWSKPAVPFWRPMPLALYPPKGGVGAVSGGAVDAEEAGAQPTGNRQAVLDRTGHHVARQSIWLSLAMRTASSSSVYGMTASTGPKISSCAIVILLSTSANSVGLTKKPPVEPGGLLGSADHQPRALLDALIDVAADPAALFVRDHRTAQGRRVLRIPPWCDAFVDALEHLDAFVVARPRQQQPGGGVRTALPGVHARRDAHHAAQCEVGVLKHDRRGLATEFEEQPFHGGRTLLHDPLPDNGGPGERDEVDLRGQRQLFPPTKWSDAVTTFTTPGGMSVFSAISRPRRVAL